MSEQRPEGAKGKALQAMGTAQAKAEKQVPRRWSGDKPEGEKEPPVLPLMTSQQPQGSAQHTRGLWSPPPGHMEPERRPRHKGAVSGTQTGNLQLSPKPEKARGAHGQEGQPGGWGVYQGLDPESPELVSKAEGSRLSSGASLGPGWSRAQLQKQGACRTG